MGRIGDIAIAERCKVALDRRRDRHECTDDVGLGITSTSNSPDVRLGKRIAALQIVEHEPHFTRQCADARVIAVDEFATEFDHLRIRKESAQA